MRRIFAALLSGTFLAIAAVGIASAAPMQIKFAYPSAPRNALYTVGAKAWVDAVNAAADGRMDIKIFPGGSIANNSNMYDRVTEGVAGIGLGVFGPVSSIFPQANVATLPFEARNHREDALALWHLYKSGVIADEFKAVHPLAFIVFPGIVIHSKKPIHSLGDMKGLKVSVEGRVLSRVMLRLGATPISLQPGDLYESLQRGLVEAVPQGWPSVPIFHLDEVTNFHLEVPLGYNTGFVFMNKKTYAELPPKGREAVNSYSGKAYVLRLSHADDLMEAQGLDMTRAMKGQTIAHLSPTEAARWKKLVQPVIEQWVKATPDGAKVLAAFRVELTKLRSGK